MAMGEFVDDAVSALFKPAKVGEITTSHRIVLAPLTRYRANDRHVHTDIAVTYYSQRASVPGTLLISEATYIAPYAGRTSPHVPGIWNEEQTAAWKRIVDAVHDKGSYIFLQLWALGRAAVPDELRAENPNFPYVSASDIPMENASWKDIPRPLTIPEIKDYVAAYAQAARNAAHGAGCDGVEIHGAHGYLVDQFIQDVSNQRTDEYGGSIENRCRFALEVIDAVAEAVGDSRVGFRISPWSTFLSNECAQNFWLILVSQIAERHPNLAYLHVVNPGLAGNDDIERRVGESNDFLRKIWFPRPFISAGRYTRESAMKRTDDTGELVAFGRLFISNPDLPLRLLKNIPLTRWQRAVYSSPVGKGEGYIDYPFAKENIGEAKS